MFNAGLNHNKLGEVYILLHMECELKCKVCPYWGAKGACNNNLFQKKYTNIKLDFQRLKKFIDEVSKYEPRTITLSGGEPLLHPYWVDLAKYIKSKGMKVSISTNGLYLHKYMKEIMKYVDGIQLSLGGTKDILYKIRDADYGFDTVINSIKELNLYKDKLQRRTPYIRIIYVISHLSYNKIKEFYEYFRKNSIRIDNFYFQHVMYIDENNLAKQKDLQESDVFLWQGFLYKPGKIDFDEFLKQKHYLQQFKNISFSPKLSDEQIPLYYNPEKKHLVKNDMMCFAPWAQVDVYPNGDIMVCPDYVIGNLNKNSFDEIWEGRKIKKLRQYIRKDKRFSSCQSCFYYYVSNEDK